MTVAALKSRAFREAREEDWSRLERLLARLEKGSLRQLSDDELIALPALYRSALSSLSTARAVSLDLALVEYLESLCTRAYFAVYGVRARPLAQAAAFFRSGWPKAVRRLWRETLTAAAITVVGALVGYLLVRGEPDWFSAIVGPGLAGGRGPEASPQFLRETLYKSDRSGLAVLASFLFTHNAQVAIYAFALGFALCGPTALLAAANGATLGAFVAVYDAKGLAPQLWGWLLIHGTTELFAVTLACAAGLRLGVTMTFPGDRTRVDALAQEGRQAATVMAGVILMLAVAGVLEGFARQLITSDLARYGVAAAMAAFWLTYFYGVPLLQRLRRRQT